MHDEAQKGPLCSNSGSSLNVQFVYWKALNARLYGKWSLHVQRLWLKDVVFRNIL